MSESGEGHNSGAVNGGQLLAGIQRIERLEEEKSIIADDIKDVYAEYKGNGFDPKIMRQCVSIRAKDRKNADKRAEEETLLEIYMRALGMPPLFNQEGGE